MVGYYPQREEGELLYSTTARAAAIMYPGKSARCVAKQMLGDGNLTFGGAFPNNASHLLENIMPITGLTKESIVDGSLYHLLAPLLETEERAKLMASMFDGDSRGMRGWFHRLSSHLRYCVLCARRDAKQNRPAIWRVVPNHPAVSCCAEHKCKLTITQARLDLHDLHDPERWIDPTVSVPDIASKEEIEVAADAQWLYIQRSNYLPGFRKVTASLRGLLLQTPEYCQGLGQLLGTQILGDLKNKMPVAVTTLDPQLLENKEGSILTTRTRHSLQRYSLLAQLVGWNLRGLFENILFGPNQRLRDVVTEPKRWTPEMVDQAKLHLAKVIEENPSAGRVQVIKICTGTVDIIRRKDPQGYRNMMPSRRRRGRNSCFDWSAKDRALLGRLSVLAGSLGSDAQSARRILSRVGLSREALDRARGRLPKTKALVFSLKDAWWKNHRRFDLAGAA